MIELVRYCFMALYRDDIINNHYIILNDNYFYSDFYAANENEAIKYFKSLVL